MPPSEPDLIWLYYSRCAVTMLLHDQQHHTCWTTVISRRHWFRPQLASSCRGRRRPQARAAICLVPPSSPSCKSGLVFLSGLRRGRLCYVGQQIRASRWLHIAWQTLTPTSWKRNRRPTGGSSQWILRTVKILLSIPFFFEMIRFYLPVWSCMWFNHVTSFGAFVYQLCGNGDSAPFCPIFLSDNH